MKLNYSSLAGQLARKLLPVYLINGNEPLLVQEAAELIRQQAYNQGYQERVKYTVDSSFDWQEFLQQSQSLSLFSQQQLIELQIQQNKINQAAGQALIQYLQSPPADKILVLITDKLSGAQQQTAWYKAIDTTGIIIDIWPIEAQQFPQWIAKRLQQAGIQTTEESIALITEFTLGNLLAAQQVIEKLKMAYGSGSVDTQTVNDILIDQAQFDVFQLADYCLQTATPENAQRIIRCIEKLQAEGIEPPIVLWALVKDLRILAAIAYDLQSQPNIHQTINKHKLHPKRKSLIQTKVASKNYKDWLNLLHEAAMIDHIIKTNAANQNSWVKLTDLALKFHGL